MWHWKIHIGCCDKLSGIFTKRDLKSTMDICPFSLSICHLHFVMGPPLKKVELDDQKINSRFLKSRRDKLHTGKQRMIDE